jgi:hypothetical protein
MLPAILEPDDRLRRRAAGAARGDPGRRVRACTTSTPRASGRAAAVSGARGGAGQRGGGVRGRWSKPRVAWRTKLRRRTKAGRLATPSVSPPPIPLDLRPAAQDRSDEMPGSSISPGDCAEARPVRGTPVLFSSFKPPLRDEISACSDGSPLMISTAWKGPHRYHGIEQTQIRGIF